MDTILQHVATHHWPDASLAKADAALMDDSGDGALHRVTALKALGRCALAAGFVQLPRFLAATRGFLVAGGGAKAAGIFDKLRESVASSDDVDAISAALEPACVCFLDERRGEYPPRSAEISRARRGERLQTCSLFLSPHVRLWLVDELVGAGKLKRERGEELPSNAKQAAKRVVHSVDSRPLPYR